MHDPRINAIPDIHGHVKGEHRAYAEERPIPYTARMLFLWFYHACVKGAPRFLMASDHMNLLTFEDPSAVNLVRRALKLAQAGDLYGAAETANVDVAHAAAVSEGLRKRNMRYSIGAEVDNDPRCRPDAANIVDAMRPDGMIRAVHFIPIDHPTHGAGWQWAYDYPEFSSLYDHVGTEKVWKLYTDALFNAIETLPGQVIAHFYKPAIFGHWPDVETLQGYENKLIEMCKERSVAIELNSRIFYKSTDGDQMRRFRDANLRLLKKAKAADVLVSTGADAHSPRDQGGGYETVLELLDAADINELAFPIAGRLARVALKVERPAPAPAPERVPDAAPATESKRRKPAAKAAEAAEPARTAVEAPTPKRAPAKRAKAEEQPAPAETKEAAPAKVPSAKPKAAPKAAAKAAAAPAPPKPASKPVAAKVPPKAVAAKTAAAKTVAVKTVALKAAAAKPAPAKAAAAKAVPAKAAPKPAVKTKPAARAKPAPAKAKAPAKAAAVKAKPSLKKAPAKTPAKKAPPAKKAAPAKSAAARKAPAKKAGTAPARSAKNAKLQRKPAAPAAKKHTKSRR